MFGGIDNTIKLYDQLAGSNEFTSLSNLYTKVNIVAGKVTIVRGSPTS